MDGNCLKQYIYIYIYTRKMDDNCLKHIHPRDVDDNFLNYMYTHQGVSRDGTAGYPLHNYTLPKIWYKYVVYTTVVL